MLSKSLILINVMTALSYIEDIVASFSEYTLLAQNGSKS